MTSLVLVKITLHVIWCYTISWTLSTGFEEDPEASGLLIPNFLNEYHVVDEEEELYGVKWGKEVYSQNFPKLDRPSEKWVTSFIHDVMHSVYTYNRDCLFTRNFVRNSVKSLEVNVNAAWVMLVLLNLAANNENATQKWMLQCIQWSWHEEDTEIINTQWRPMATRPWGYGELATIASTWYSDFSFSYRWQKLLIM